MNATRANRKAPTKRLRSEAFRTTELTELTVRRSRFAEAWHERAVKLQSPVNRLVALTEGFRVAVDPTRVFSKAVDCREAERILHCQAALVMEEISHALARLPMGDTTNVQDDGSTT